MSARAREQVSPEVGTGDDSAAWTWARRSNCQQESARRKGHVVSAGTSEEGKCRGSKLQRRVLLVRRCLADAAPEPFAKYGEMVPAARRLSRRLGRSWCGRRAESPPPQLGLTQRSSPPADGGGGLSSALTWKPRLREMPASTPTTSVPYSVALRQQSGESLVYQVQNYTLFHYGIVSATR